MDNNIELKPIIEAYNVDEEYLYNESYIYIKGHAGALKLSQTLKALPLARQIHNGQYRKGTVIVDGKEVKLPYVLHVLKVCSTLISLGFNEKDNDLDVDILYAAALCHDMLEDRKDLFPKGGIELYTKYNFDKRIYEIVRLLSKQSGANEYELNEYFNNIKYNKYALLVKLADRSHNVETLSCMEINKIHKYVDETRRWIYPLCTYAKDNYPELSNGITILKAKIVSLTEETELLVNKFTEKLDEKDQIIKELNEKIKQMEKEIEHGC